MSNPSFPPNPIMSQWLSMANAAAAPWRGAFAGEWQRQQMAALEAWNRQVLTFWTGAFARATALPRTPAQAEARHRDEPNGAVTLPSIPAPAVEPQLVAMAEAVPLGAAPAPEPPVPASVAPTPPEPVASTAATKEAGARKPKAKGAAGLQAAVARRKGPAPKAQRTTTAPKTQAKRSPTRH